MRGAVRRLSVAVVAACLVSTVLALAPPVPAGALTRGAELTALRTPTSTTFATDEAGTYVTDLFTEPARFRKPTGGWANVNRRMRVDAADATLITPVSMPLPTRFARDSTSPDLGRVEAGGGTSVSVGLAGAAPGQAVLAGEKVIHSAIAPGVNLELSAQVTGFRADVVLTDPATATSPVLLSLGLGGLHLDERRIPELVLRDGEGATRAHVTETIAVDSAAHPISGAPTRTFAYRELTGDLSAPVLELRVDEAWLQDPARVFPIRLQTEVVVPAPTGAARVDSWNTHTLGARDLAVGFDGTADQRSVLTFADVAPFRTKTVVAASLVLPMAAQAQCGPTTIVADSQTQAWRPGSALWWPGPAAEDAVASAVLDPATGGCAAGDVRLDLTGVVSAWAADPSLVPGVVLRMADPFDPLGFRTLTAPPRIELTWSDPVYAAPLVPTSLKPQGVIDKLAPQLAAVYKDPQKDAGRIDFTVTDLGTGAVVLQAPGSTVASGQASRLRMAAGLLAVDGRYRLDAVAVDANGNASAPAAPVEFTLAGAAISSPGPDRVLFHVEDVAATVTRSPAVTRVELLVDGAVAATTTTYPFVLAWDTTASSDGTHAVQVRSVHRQGIIRTSEPVQLTVDNSLTTRERLDLDLARGALTQADWTLLSATALVDPTLTTAPRYQSPTPMVDGETTAELLRILAAGWSSLTPEQQDELRTLLGIGAPPLPAPEYTAQADDPATFLDGGGAPVDPSEDSSETADGPGDPEKYPACGTTSHLVINGHGSEWCSMTYIYGGSRSGVPDIDLYFTVGNGWGDDVPDRDDDANHIPDYVDHVAYNMWNAAEVYRDMGFELDGDLSERITVAIFDSGRGFANPFVDPHPVSIPKANSDASTPRHEMFHLFQYHYVSMMDLGEEYLPGDLGRDSNLWWLEASAEWAEHQVGVVRPTLRERDDYYSNLDRFLADPSSELQEFDDGLQRHYGAFVLAEWLHEQFDEFNGNNGQPQWDTAPFVLRTYQELQEQDSFLGLAERASIEVIEDVIEDEHDSSFREVLPSFWEAAYLLDDTVLPNVVTGMTARPDLQWRCQLPGSTSIPGNHCAEPGAVHHAGKWRGELSSNGDTDGDPGDIGGRARAEHIFTAVPADGSEVDASFDVSPGGAKFVDVEPEGELNGLIHATVKVSADRDEKFVVSVLQYDDTGTLELCAAPDVREGDGSTGGETSAGAPPATASGESGNPNQRASLAETGAGASFSSGEAGRFRPNGSGELDLVFSSSLDCPNATLVVTMIDPNSTVSSDHVDVTFELLDAGVVLENGRTRMGVNDKGHLNLPQSGVGLAFDADGSDEWNDALYPGCLCEGWGAGDATSGLSGYASENFGDARTTLISMTRSGSTRATSKVGIGDESDGEFPLEVTHEFSRATEPDGGWVDDVFAIDVTLKNTTDAPMEARYRRVMDWDVTPTPFSEHVTIGHVGDVPGWLLRTTNNGFDVADPLQDPTPLGSEGEAVDGFFTDVGPYDHGALFDLDLGTLAPGEETHFTMYYGAADTEAGALLAILALGAPVYSLGQTADDPSGGTPNTFLFAVKEG